MNSDNKQISQQASKSHVSGTKPESTKASQRRPAQLALTQVPIDIARNFV